VITRIVYIFFDTSLHKQVFSSLEESSSSWTISYMFITAHHIMRRSNTSKGTLSYFSVTTMHRPHEESLPDAVRLAPKVSASVFLIGKNLHNSGRGREWHWHCSDDVGQNKYQWYQEATLKHKGAWLRVFVYHRNAKLCEVSYIMFTTNDARSRSWIHRKHTKYYKKLNVITQVTLYNQICDGRPFGSILYRTGRPSAFMSCNNSETTSFTF